MHAQSYTPAAFVLGHQRGCFGINRGKHFSFRNGLVLCKILRLTETISGFAKSGASPKEFDALLLFALPLVFTLQKLLALL